jgi:hypothetical protein
MSRRSLSAFGPWPARFQDTLLVCMSSSDNFAIFACASRHILLALDYTIRCLLPELRQEEKLGRSQRRLAEMHNCNGNNGSPRSP